MRNIVLIVAILFCACKEEPVNPNIEMGEWLKEVKRLNAVPENLINSEFRIAHFDSVYRATKDPNQSLKVKFQLLRACLENGDENLALGYGNEMLKQLADSAHPNEMRTRVMKEMAIAWMRIAEKKNCIGDHNAESCIFPIQGGGVHKNKMPAEKAIALYEQLLSENPDDIHSRWLLNIAYMTTDGYPGNVPPKFLIPGLDNDTVTTVKPFVDAAIRTGLDVFSRAGAVIVDDFTNDGYLDVIISSENLDEHMHFFINNGNGTFSDATEYSGLNYLWGGLNIMQTDYNNDGWKDVFVTRRGHSTNTYATEPNSLLRNNGDGTFTDVTRVSGLFAPHQSQSAVWADFNNDGWLDVYIANQAMNSLVNVPSELYINNQDGTFSNVSVESNTRIVAYAKGVTAADYNNDGLMDIFISGQDGTKFLFENVGIENKIPKFKDITTKAGIKDKNSTSTTWFFDYDNDGWQDILIHSKKFPFSPVYYYANEALGNKLPGYDAKMYLYRNNGDGTFEEVSKDVGLDKVSVAMGSNFGDFDNDGFLDFYIGSGNLDFSVLVPNRLFRNERGVSFTDVTLSARVGNLQKGHGVSFADLDNDGDQDIYVDMGGAFKGDAYQGSLYINPGQNDNKWIKLELVGVKANRPAIGAHIKVCFREGGKERVVYREVNSGSSYGANPLLQHIGIGSAVVVDSVIIKWPGINTVQVFNHLESNQQFTITEGNDIAKKRTDLKKMDFLDKNRTTIGCAPLSLKK